MTARIKTEKTRMASHTVSMVVKEVLSQALGTIRETMDSCPADPTSMCLAQPIKSKSADTEKIK